MLIGLTGKARSGKDTVGDWLETEMGFQRVAAQKVNAHQGEAGVAKVEGDFMLENNSTLDSLYAKISEKLCG